MTRNGEDALGDRWRPCSTASCCFRRARWTICAWCTNSGQRSWPANTTTSRRSPVQRLATTIELRAERAGFEATSLLRGDLARIEVRIDRCLRLPTDAMAAARRLEELVRFDSLIEPDREYLELVSRAYVQAFPNSGCSRCSGGRSMGQPGLLDSG